MLDREPLRRFFSLASVLSHACSSDGSTVPSTTIRAWALASGSITTAVIRSDDGGASWAVASELEGTRLNDIRFVDSDTGWLVGQGALFQTTNGGSSWVDSLARTDLPTDVEPRLFSVAASSPETVVAVGDETPAPPPLISGRPLILRTIDGGQSWRTTRVDARMERVTLQKVCLTPAGTGLALGSGPQGSVMLRTTDSGGTWQDIIARVGRSPRDAACVDENDLWVLGRGPDGRLGLSQSRDGGESWADASAPTRQVLDEVYSVAFADADEGWATGPTAGGFGIAYTNNGGLVWSRQNLPMNGVADMLVFANPLTGVGTGSRQGRAAVFYTEDGGVTWAEGDLPDLSIERLLSANAVD